MFCIDAGETLTAIAKELAKGKQLFPTKEKSGWRLKFSSNKIVQR